MTTTTATISLTDLDDISITNVDRSDYPDFSDAYVEQAYWKGGEELTDDELCNIHTCEVNERIHSNQLYF